MSAIFHRADDRYIFQYLILQKIIVYAFYQGILRAYQGDREAAYAEVQGATANNGREVDQPVIEAMVFAGLGEADAAMPLLLRAEEEAYPHLEYLPTHPFFDNIRSDSRFQALLERLDF